MSGVSQAVLNKAAVHFIRNAGMWFSREDIQRALDISKPTACRLMNELTFRIPITEKKEGRIIYYRINEDDAKAFYASVDMFLKMTDSERMVMSLLLGSGQSSDIFEPESTCLLNRLNNAGILSVKNGIIPIHALKGLPQKIDVQNKILITRIYKAIEFCNPVSLSYQNPWNKEPKTYTVWPIGIYLRDSNLYLYSFNPKYENGQSNAFSRIHDAEIIDDEHFTVPQGLSFENIIDDPFGIAIDSPQRVTVEIYGRQAYFEKEKQWPKGTIITNLPEGAIRMELTIRDKYSFMRWVMSLSCFCKVISPREYVDWAIKEIEETRIRYSNNTDSLYEGKR